LISRADLTHCPNRHLVLQELIHGQGRYAGGGDTSHQLLDLTAALILQYPGRVHYLIGNHELAQTTRQFIGKGTADLNADFLAGVAEAYPGRAAEVMAAYDEMFAVAPLALRTANRIFLSHSLPSATRLPNFDPSVLKREISTRQELQPGGSVYALLWGRDPSAENAQAFLDRVDADLLITGHIPCETGYTVPNDRQMILDSHRSPACYCLFPTDRPLSQAELVTCIANL
jgi:hypothetical protein